MGKDGMKSCFLCDSTERLEICSKCHSISACVHHAHLHRWFVLLYFIILLPTTPAHRWFVLFSILYFVVSLSDYSSYTYMQRWNISFCISLFYCPKAQHLHLQRWIVSLLFFPFVFLDLIARHVWIRLKQEIPVSHICQTYISWVKQEIPLSYILSAKNIFRG